MVNEERQWNVYVIGSATAQVAGAGILIISLEDDKFEHALKFSWKASNNEAEYEALIRGIEMAKATGAIVIKAYSDSSLVVNQVLGEY